MTCSRTKYKHLTLTCKKCVIPENLIDVECPYLDWMRPSNKVLHRMPSFKDKVRSLCSHTIFNAEMRIDNYSRCVDFVCRNCRRGADKFEDIVHDENCPSLIAREILDELGKE
jgi:hypothetical protein